MNLGATKGITPISDISETLLISVNESWIFTSLLCIYTYSRASASVIYTAFNVFNIWIVIALFFLPHSWWCYNAPLQLDRYMLFSLD